MPPCQSGICSIFPFSWIDVHEWQHLVISKHIYHRHCNTFLVVISNIFGTRTEKRNIIVTFQSCQLTKQPKTLDDLGRFDLKMFRNCPIRIEIITGSHIFILFLPLVVTVCLILPLATARGKIFGVKCQPRYSSLPLVVKCSA
jgi:hypothetical protein